MFLKETLIACPSCNCHARAPSVGPGACPHCGAPLRREDGTVPRTAGAVLLGLLVATAACSGGVEVASGGTGGETTSTSGTGAQSTTASTGTTSTGTTTTTTTTHFGCGGSFSGADYGVPPTCTTSTTTSSTTTGGTGGAH